MKGIVFSLEHRKNLSKVATGRKLSEKSRIKISEAQKGQHHSPETEFKKGHIVSSKTREKMSASHKGKKKGPWSEKSKKKMIRALKGRHLSPKTEFTSERTKKMWQDPKFVKMMCKARVLKPTKPEKELNKILQEAFPNNFKYTGDGRQGVTLGGKIPDFINTNGKKQVILMNGVYWHLHRNKDPSLTRQKVEEQERKPYNKFGFKVLHIWEDELKNENGVIEKIEMFMNR